MSYAETTRGELAEIRVENVTLTAAPSPEQDKGLLGWISCDLNGSLRLDGLSLRRTARGHFTVAFPARRDASGQQHFYIRPLNNHARRHVERQIFAALGIEEGGK